MFPCITLYIQPTIFEPKNLTLVYLVWTRRCSEFHERNRKRHSTLRTAHFNSRPSLFKVQTDLKSNCIDSEGMFFTYSHLSTILKTFSAMFHKILPNPLNISRRDFKLWSLYDQINISNTSPSYKLFCQIRS